MLIHPVTCGELRGSRSSARSSFDNRKVASIAKRTGEIEAGKTLSTREIFHRTRGLEFDLKQGVYVGFWK
jgi:hypothetical protein